MFVKCSALLVLLSVDAAVLAGAHRFSALAVDELKHPFGGGTDIVSKVAAMGLPSSNLRPMQSGSDTPSCPTEARALGTCFSGGSSTDFEACLDCVDSYFPYGLRCGLLDDACAVANDFCPSCGSCGSEFADFVSCVACDSQEVTCSESLTCPEEAKAARSCLDGNSDGLDCIPCVVEKFDDSNIMCFEYEEDTCNAFPVCGTCSGCEEAVGGWLGCIGGCGDFTCGDDPTPTPPNPTPTLPNPTTTPPNPTTSPPNPTQGSELGTCTKTACACTTSSGTCPSWFYSTYAQIGSIGSINGQDGYCAGGSSTSISVSSNGVEVNIDGRVIPGDQIGPCPASAP